MKIVPRLQSLIDKTAINSWSWYYYLFLYSIIPFIILIIPVLGFDNLFVLDICHPIFLSMYMHSFYHLTLAHLSENLASYLLLITGILFLEKDKIRFHNMLAFLFVILPIVISILNIEYLGNFCTVQESTPTYGFSAITLGFFGYFIYLVFLSSIPRFFKMSEDEFYSSKIKGIEKIYFIVIVNLIIAFVVIRVGAEFGRFSLINGAPNSNSLAHSVGYVSGIFVPIILELKKEGKLDSFHRTVLIHFEALITFLTVYFIFFYFMRIA